MGQSSDRGRVIEACGVSGTWHRYRLAEELSSCQGGVVVRAQKLPPAGGDPHEESAAVYVALKLVSGVKWKSMLLREADVLKTIAEAQSASSRIVRIGAGGEMLTDGDRFFIELEFLDGVTLGAWLDAHQEPRLNAAQRDEVLPHAIRWVGEIAHALDELGALGGDHAVLHRDIKPDNIMVTSAGLRLFDFNVAREHDADTLTRHTGTRGFMAPEVAFGDGHYDHRADLYSLGVVAWLLLHRRPMPKWLEPALWREAYCVPWPSSDYEDLDPRVAEPLERLMTGLLCDRARRFATAADALAATRAVADAIELVRRPPAPDVDALFERFDLVQLVSELRPSGVSAVVTDLDDPARLDASQQVIRERLQVTDAVETWLAQRLRAAFESQRATLVVLAGNAGDGKSHLIDQMRRTLPAPQAEALRYLADATHADPGETREARLDRFFAPFADDATAPAAGVHLIAINTGMVIRFFEHDRDGFDGRFATLYRAFHRLLGLGETAPVELPFELEVVNLDLRSLLRGTSSFLVGLLDQLDPTAEDGLPALKWSGCDTCPARPVCPVHFNLEALRRPVVRASVAGLLRRAALEPSVHLSPRNLRGFMYRLITGGEERFDCRPDESPCDVIRRRSTDYPWLLDGQFTEVLFAGRGGPVWSALEVLDPAYASTSEIDALHTELAIDPDLDGSEEELARLGGHDGALAGLSLRRVSSAVGTAPIAPAARRNAAVRRRVVFNPQSFEQYVTQGCAHRYEETLAAYGAYSQLDASRLSTLDRGAQAKLAELRDLLKEVFALGCGRRVAGRSFLRVSQPQPHTPSQLLVELRAEDGRFGDLFLIPRLFGAGDVHLRLHRDRPALLDALGYEPRVMNLDLAGMRVVIDLDLFDFLVQVGEGRQPSKQDLAQFEVLAFLGDHIGNLLARPVSGRHAPLFVFDDEHRTLHQLSRNEFDALDVERIC